MAKSGSGKRKALKAFLILIIIIGVSLILYPTVSDYVNSLSFYRAINKYNSAVAELDRETYEKILGEAYTYNTELSERSEYFYDLTAEQKEKYKNILNIMGDGVMGYIEIPKINVSLPIYHGTSEAVLQSGVGHYENSSLPVGGESVHTVLSGHTGLPSSKLFTDIRELEVGDTFIIHVLNETLTYEVESVEVVLPEKLDELQIERGKDLCTLFTCTPYGVNTHRLVVRAHRIENRKELSEDNQNQAIDSQKNMLKWILIIAIPLILISLVAILIAKHKKKKRFID